MTGLNTDFAIFPESKKYLLTIIIEVELVY